MTQSVVLPVPNSVLLVMDHLAGVIPKAMNGELISSTSSCISVGTAAENDELVEIVLTNDSPPHDSSNWQWSEHRIETPNKVISERVLKLP